MRFPALKYAQVLGVENHTETRSEIHFTHNNKRVLVRMSKNITKEYIRY